MEFFTMFFRRRCFFVAAALVLLTGLATSQARAEAMAAPSDMLHKKLGMIVDKEGRNIGTIAATVGPHGTMLDIDVHSLTPGKHGMHMHAIGICDPDAGFKSAGGHINTAGKGHGLLYADGPHEGDLPNLVVGEDGTAKAQIFSHLLTWGLLADEDGAALIIHEGTDDHMTQPLGGSGGRAACGAFATAE